MLGVMISEAPFLRWIGPLIPLKSVQKLFKGEDLVFEHGAVAVQNMRTDSANTQNLFGQMLSQADSQEKTDLTDSTVSYLDNLFNTDCPTSLCARNLNVLKSTSPLC